MDNLIFIVLGCFFAGCFIGPIIVFSTIRLLGKKQKTFGENYSAYRLRKGVPPLCRPTAPSRFSRPSKFSSEC